MNPAPLDNMARTSLNGISIDAAFDYDTRIAASQFKPLKFSKVCIFCNSSLTQALMKDGSFCQCLSCKKTFKAVILLEKV